MTTASATQFPSYDDLGRSIYTGDGSTTNFNIDFDYIGKSTFDGSTESNQFKVYVGTTLDAAVETSAWTQTDANIVTMTSAPANNYIVAIIRNSQADTLRSTFQSGNRITAGDLTTMYKQLLYCVQELNDNHAALAQFVDEHIGTVGNHFSATATGSSQAITLTGETGLDIYSILVTVNGSYVETTGYTVADVANVSTVTITATVGQTIRVRVLTGGVLAAATPAAGTVGTNQIVNSAVTFAKINFDSSGTNGQSLFKRAGVAVFDNTVAADIADFNTAVRTNKVTDLTAPTGNFNMNNNKITNLTTCTSSLDAANKTYVDTAVAASVISSLDSGRVLSGTFTATGNFATTTLSLGQFDTLYVLPVAAPSSSFNPLLPIYSYLGTTADTLQTTVVTSNTALNAVYSLKLQRLSTGFRAKTADSASNAPNLTTTWFYIAIRNSNVP